MRASDDPLLIDVFNLNNTDPDSIELRKQVEQFPVECVDATVQAHALSTKALKESAPSDGNFKAALDGRLTEVRKAEDLLIKLLGSAYKATRNGRRK